MKAATPAEVGAPPQFTLLRPSQLRQRPRQQDLVSRIIPSGSLAALFGPSGSGKSFLVLDLVSALGEASAWFGHRAIAWARVCYVSLEGPGGQPQRLKAWEKDRGRPFPEKGIFFLLDPFRLNDSTDVLMLSDAIATAGGADLIVVDTLNRATPGADENSSKDMGVTLECCRLLQAETGATVLLVAHTGKDAQKGLRGHSSLFAALDAAIEVERTPDGREWRLAKSKDGQDGISHRFRLEVVDLGEDEFGEPLTSCVVKPDMTDAPKARAKLPIGGNQKIVYDALAPLFRDSHHRGKVGAPGMRPCLEMEAAIVALRGKLPVESARQTERTREAIKGLISRRVLGFEEGWLWLT